MDNRIILFIGLLFFVNSASAMITEGGCSGSIILTGSTCQATGFRLSDVQTYVIIKVIDTSEDENSVMVSISAFWDNSSQYPYFGLINQVINKNEWFTYTNPDDVNDFVQLSPYVIFTFGDGSFAQFHVNYQQTSYVKTTGSDSFNGNKLSTAWLTVIKSQSTILTGEDVIVQTGTYDGFNTGGGGYNGQGLSNAPIIFIGDGTYPVINPTSAQTIRFASAPKYINISGFKIQNTGENYYNYGVCWCDSTLGQTSNDINIYNNNFSVSSSYGVVVLGSLSKENNHHIFNNTFYGANGFEGSSSSDNSNYIYNNYFFVSNSQVEANTNWYPSLNFIGNYYSQYIGIDVNGDKIGDTPMETGTNDDNYPLMDRESGYALNNHGTPLSNASVYQSGATYRNTTTDLNGHYNLSTIGRNTVLLIGNKTNFFEGNITTIFDNLFANITLNPYDTRLSRGDRLPRTTSRLVRETE